MICTAPWTRIDSVWNPVFAKADADCAIEAMRPTGAACCKGTDEMEPAEDESSQLAALCRAPLLGLAEERYLFCRMNFAKHLSRIAAEKCCGHSHDPWAAKARARFQEALRIRNRIVEANLRLVVSTARHFSGPLDELDELVAASLPALIRAVELYDFARGYRFSTYASHALRNYHLRHGRRSARRRHKLVLAPPIRMERNEDTRGSARASRLRVLESRLTVRRLLGHLPRRDRFVISARFGLGKHARAHTFEEVGRMLKLSKERARVLTGRALDRLREVAQEQRLHGRV